VFVSHKQLNFCNRVCAVPKLNNYFLHKRTRDCLGSAQFLDRQQDICVTATSLSLLSILLPSPSHCNSYLALRPPSLPCPLLCDKEEGPLQALPLPEGLFKSLLIDERRQRYQIIPQCALIWLALSPWRNLLALQNNQVCITMMGFDCESFDRILEKFSPMFSGHKPFDASGMVVEFEYVRGHRRVVQTADCLGLVLVWTQTMGVLNVLQLVCGLIYSNPSIWDLEFGSLLRRFSMTHLQEWQSRRGRR
jgi:hypothetical protein